MGNQAFSSGFGCCESERKDADLVKLSTQLASAGTSVSRMEEAPQDVILQVDGMDPIRPRPEEAKDTEQTQHYKDGSMYTGQMKDSKRHGAGVFKSGAEQYEGQWLEDQQHGEGHQRWSDGRSYDGQFRLGEFHGRGRMVWQTRKGELVYEGQYLYDLKDGHGKFTWPDGRVYDGSWVKGQRHGRALYTVASKGSRVCYWADDAFQSWETARAEQDASNKLMR